MQLPSYLTYRKYCGFDRRILKTLICFIHSLLIEKLLRRVSIVNTCSDAVVVLLWVLFSKPVIEGTFVENDKRFY